MKLLRAISWCVAPGGVPFEAPVVAEAVLGYSHPADNRIVLLEWIPNRTSLVRHESLHAMDARSRPALVAVTDP